MNYTFVLHTTTNNSIPIIVNSSITTKELHALFIRELESNRMFRKNQILDIFAHDKLYNYTLSFPKTNETIEKYVYRHRDYYPSYPIFKNTYDVYVIDVMFNEHLRHKFCFDMPEKTIKTNHMDNLYFSIKNILSHLYP